MEWRREGKKKQARNSGGGGDYSGGFCPLPLFYFICFAAGEEGRGGARRKDDEGEEERHFSQSPCAFNCYFNENSPTARHCPRVPPRARSSGPDIAAIFFSSLSLFLFPLLSFSLSFFRETYARALQFLRVSLPVSRAFYQMQMTPECSPEIQL